MFLGSILRKRVHILECNICFMCKSWLYIGSAFIWYIIRNIAACILCGQLACCTVSIYSETWIFANFRGPLEINGPSRKMWNQGNVCIHPSIHTYTHTHTRTCMHTHIHTYIHICMYVVCTHTHTFTESSNFVIQQLDMKRVSIRQRSTNTRWRLQNKYRNINND